MAETDHGYHVPVQGPEVLAYLAPVADGCYVDCTAGGGGHCALLLSQLGPAGRCVALDRDPDAIAHLEQRFRGEQRLLICRSAFSCLGSSLNQLGLSRVNGFLFDLGVSSHQLDTPGRGFSYRGSGPLDMRMDPDRDEPVSHLLARASDNEIATVLREVGEVHSAHRIAARIANNHPRSTAELRAAVEQAIGRPASPSLLSKIFMALRIWVNREFEELAAGLEQAFSFLAPEGRIAVISYHSGEDRIVKNWMRDKARTQPDKAVLLTKKPVYPADVEVNRNPRARSARMRDLKARSEPEYES